MKALQIEKTWEHAETEHFIIHYQTPWIRDRIGREAEFYYWKIKNDLKLENEIIPHKSHIFTFQDPALWRQFCATVNYLTIDGVTLQNEFFARVPKEQSDINHGLIAHEMTHLVFNRFYPNPPPMWLNEGLADFQGASGYRALYGMHDKPKPCILMPEKELRAHFLAITDATRYPEEPKARYDFYATSHAAVDLFIEKGGYPRFVKFLEQMIHSPDFIKRI